MDLKKRGMDDFEMKRYRSLDDLCVHNTMVAEEMMKRSKSCCPEQWTPLFCSVIGDKLHSKPSDALLHHLGADSEFF
ncbi:MAG: hypothetical protein SO135_01955, partial [Sphaerochaetaceae bacterium]|nr:hypothetical protein [Sphaerochaetaceae bacterium]